jgi:HAD superfamily phosphatase
VSPALPDGAWLNPQTAQHPFALDSVVLDVDGVLVDVRESFREAVRETVVAVQRSMGVAEPWRPAHEDILAFKRAGGFNDDIDLGIALAAIGAAGRAADIPQTANAVERAGGGLAALRAVAPDLPRVSGREVLRIFDGLYWGGLVHRERVLVPHDFVAQLRGAGARTVALITGRTPRELDAALQRLRWNRAELCHVLTGDVVRKPDPACLDVVAQQCNPRSLVYVGDVRDDWELVRRWRNERPDGVPARGILVGEDAEMELYRPLGVDATVRHTADVLGALRRWR